MAKKLNIENPALNFISTPVLSNEQEVTQAETVKANSVPNGYRVVYVEKRTERLQLLVPPSIKAKLKETADKEGKSVNDIINSLLQEHL